MVALCLFVLLLVSELCATESGVVSFRIDAGSFTIDETSRGHEIRMNDFGRLPGPGVPLLPARIFSIAIPPGSKVTGVTFDSGAAKKLDGEFRIPPAPLCSVIQESFQPSEVDRELYDRNRTTIYSLKTPYPEAPAELVGPAYYRQYELVEVRVCPFSWNPATGELVLRQSVVVNVNYLLPGSRSVKGRSVADSARIERTARSIVANYDQAQTWYAPLKGGQGRALYDYVIITLDALTASVQPIVDWETAKGRNVHVATTTWIYANYTGYDNQEKIRNFLRDKYPTYAWGIEDVLLAGHYDDVPMRRCSVDLGYGEPETDFYYAELSLPDSASWDKDGDHKWGEKGDDFHDFVSEVNVGRIPWNNATTMQSICAKSVAFEQNTDPSFKKNILLLGAFFWPDTDNAVLMEYKTDPGLHPWMTDWTSTRLYEQGYTTYACDQDLTNSNARSVWSGGKYAFVNWAGHGSPTSCHIYYNGSGAFIQKSDCAYLNNDYPSIIFADACSNGDTDYANIGRQMLKQGGVGFLGATKVALGCPGWTDPSDGSSQSLDYYFTTGITSGNATQGESHQAALRTMVSHGLWSSLRYEVYEWGCLLGNPDLSVAEAGPVHPTADIKINGQDGPLTLFSGQPITMTVSVDPGDSAGEFQDWWVYGEKDPNQDTWWWSFPGMWTKSTIPLRAYNGPLVEIEEYVIAQSPVPQGSWTFVFAFDTRDNVYQGTHSDTIEVVAH